MAEIMNDDSLVMEISQKIKDGYEDIRLSIASGSLGCENVRVEERCVCTYNSIIASVELLKENMEKTKGYVEQISQALIDTDAAVAYNSLGKD